ncbi:MAG: hypothetical protein ACI3XR_00085 [Eubacteriales bacterium]
MTKTDDSEDQMGIPVIFYHNGNQDYLRAALMQCRKYNDSVFLLGDDTNKNIGDGIKWFRSEDYSDTDRWREFEKVYLPMSSNDPLFELNCFKRFFVIESFIREMQIKKFVYLDSDILCYVNFSMLTVINDHDVGMCVPECQEPYKWVANLRYFLLVKRRTDRISELLYGDLLGKHRFA